jgi:hypothetical protein
MYRSRQRGAVLIASLLILLVGLRAYFDLTVRQYPQSDKAVVTVQTTYVGADAELVKGFVTTPLEKEIASADGIDYLGSTSAQGVSIINAHLELNYDPIQALTQITSKVNKVRSELPEAAEDPVIDVQLGETTASMYISFTSETMENNQITDYLNRVVVPELATIAGVESANVLAGRRFAMRIWLDPHRLAAYGLAGWALALPFWVRRRRPEDGPVRRWAWIVAGLTLGQVAVGAALVLSHLPEGLQAAHLAVGTALWAALVVLAVRLGRRPADAWTGPASGGG